MMCHGAASPTHYNVADSLLGDQQTRWTEQKKILQLFQPAWLVARPAHHLS